MKHRGWIRFGFAAIVLALSAGPAARAQNQFELNEQTFTQWLYNSGNRLANPDSEIATAVEAVDLSCGLTETQKMKLRLAAKGDFARFDERVEALRTELVGKQYDQNEMGSIYQRVQKLGAIYQAGLLGDSSLFSKVLARTLDAKQHATYEGDRSERQRARYTAKVRLAVALLERSCPLTNDQRAALVDLLLSETRPPKRFSEFDSYVLLVEAARIPDEKYQRLFDDAQMQVIKQWLRPGDAMENHLREQGVLPDD